MIEIGKNNHHLLLSVLLWTLYWMTQCFAFQSFKKYAGICRGSWEAEGSNETEVGPEVWGPNSSARESPWTCQESSEVTQQDPTTTTQQSTTAQQLTAERLTASHSSVKNNSKELMNIKTDWLETMLQAEGLCFSKSSMLQSPSTGNSQPQQVGASCKPELLALPKGPLVPQATCWCLLPQLSYILCRRPSWKPITQWQLQDQM